MNLYDDDYSSKVGLLTQLKSNTYWNSFNLNFFPSSGDLSILYGMKHANTGHTNVYLHPFLKLTLLVLIEGCADGKLVD